MSDPRPATPTGRLWWWLSSTDCPLPTWLIRRVARVFPVPAEIVRMFHDEI